MELLEWEKYRDEVPEFDQIKDIVPNKEEAVVVEVTFSSKSRIKWRNRKNI